MIQTQEKPKITPTIAESATLTGFLVRRLLFSMIALFASGIVFTMLTLFLNEYVSEASVVVVVTTSALIAIALTILFYWILHKGGFFKLTYPNSCQ